MFVRVVWNYHCNQLMDRLDFGTDLKKVRAPPRSNVWNKLVWWPPSCLKYILKKQYRARGGGGRHVHHAAQPPTFWKAKRVTWCAVQWVSAWRKSFVLSEQPRKRLVWHGWASDVYTPRCFLCIYLIFTRPFWLSAADEERTCSVYTYVTCSRAEWKLEGGYLCTWLCRCFRKQVFLFWLRFPVRR